MNLPQLINGNCEHGEYVLLQTGPAEYTAIFSKARNLRPGRIADALGAVGGAAEMEGGRIEIRGAEIDLVLIAQERNIPAHEAGHCLVAALLGYQPYATADQHAGQTHWGLVTDTTHRAAIGLAGSLAELFHARDASNDEAHKQILSGSVSQSDWNFIGSEAAPCWAGLWLAVRLLRENHAALVLMTRRLQSNHAINFLEIQQCLES